MNSAMDSRSSSAWASMSRQPLRHPLLRLIMPNAQPGIRLREAALDLGQQKQARSIASSTVASSGKSCTARITFSCTVMVQLHRTRRAGMSLQPKRRTACIGLYRIQQPPNSALSRRQ